MCPELEHWHTPCSHARIMDTLDTFDATPAERLLIAVGEALSAEFSAERFLLDVRTRQAERHAPPRLLNDERLPGARACQRETR